MKALLIAESDHILSSFNDFFIKNGYDTICYNWLLKALDNVEEICPHVVLINSIDYPRHWKTLVQHIHANVGVAVLTIILVIAENFDEDEREKAEILDVYCVGSDISTEEIREQLLGLLELQKSPPLYLNEELKSKDSFAIYSVEPALQSEQIQTCSVSQDEIEVSTAINNDDEANKSTRIFFAFNHPHTQARITGIVEHYNHPILIFRPLDSAYLETIRFGKKIEACALSVEGIDSLITVQVQGMEDRMIEFCIIK